MPDENLTINRDGAVAVVTVTRPAVLNALNEATVTELEGAVGRLAADDDVRAVILTGAGDKAFVAGADIRELAALTPVTAEALAARGHALCHAIERMGKPVIAAINGYALGGGLRAGHGPGTLRIAADTAKLGQPEIGLGLLPGYGGTQRLPRLVGAGRALEMMLTGAPIDADEAWRIGLVNRVVPRDELLPRTLDLARRIRRPGPRRRPLYSGRRPRGARHDARRWVRPRGEPVRAGRRDRRLERRYARVSRKASTPLYGFMRDTPVIEGATDASGLRVCLVVSVYHRSVTGALRDGALAALRGAGARGAAPGEPGSVTLVEVPGAFEIPLAARRAAESGAFDAVVCLGCIVRGETPHFDYLASAVAHAIATASQATGVADDVRGPDHELAGRGAAARAGDGPSNKGREAALAAVQLANVIGSLPGAPRAGT